MSKKTAVTGGVASIADASELLEALTKQGRLLDAGKGDVRVANARCSLVRTHVSVIALAARLHQMGIYQPVLGLPAPKPK